jgi:MinD superfamily P-loop ATPase
MTKTLKVAITGGKGGVGKSTASILLANKLRQKNHRVILVDLDVECPNDFLLLGKDLNARRAKVMAKFPRLIKSKCTKCGLCVKNCRSNAIFQAPGKYPKFFHELCSSCGLCWNICPQQAIKPEEKLIGEIFKNKVDNNFFLITGRSFGIVDETGPIVTEVREYAEKFAKKIKADFLLFDTAVGLHCGVIRALINTDLAYAVTEPTPLGVHDLNLILKLLKKLNIKSKVIINQADVGNKEEVLDIAKKQNIEIKYQIPYSKKLVKAYSQGKLKDLNLL